MLQGTCKQADLKRLRKSVFRIGIQKDGVLTEMSVAHVEKSFNKKCPKYDRNNKILSLVIDTDKGNISVHYMRNLDLGVMVRKGFLDAAIIGTDILEEYELENNNVVSKIFTSADEAWPLYYMTPIDRQKEFKKARIIATPYPVITKHILEKKNIKNVEIVDIAGSSELMPLLTTKEGRSIDGVIDISVSGKSAEANGLIRSGRAFRKFHPVLITNCLSMSEKNKKCFFKKLCK